MSQPIKRLLLSLFLICFCASIAPADGAEQSSPGWQQKFTVKDFKFNQNALRYEIPEGSLYKIMPRLRDSMASTHFQVPLNASSLLQWEVTATVADSDNTGAGVGLWSGDNQGYVFYLFPQGDGFIRYVDGKKAIWTAEIFVRNFSYPARMTIVRDPNGSVVAKVNDIIVALRQYDADLTAAAPDKITSVSFVTISSPKAAGFPAYYESLEARAWGERRNNPTKK